MPSRKRIVLIVLALALLVLLALAFRPRPLPVELVTVAHAPLTVTVEQRGVTRVIDRYVVSAPVSGYVQRIGLRVGDSVSQGLALAQLLPSPPLPLDARSRAQAEARVAQAGAALAAARAQRDRAAAAAELAEASFERNQRLYRAGDISPERLEQLQAARLEARANLRGAEFNVDVARYELAAAHAVLDVTVEPGAAAQRQAVTVRAPVAGRVLALRQQSEGPVAAGQPLLELGDPAALEVAVDVLTSDAVRIRPGMEVRLRRWGGPEVPAAVRTVEPAGFTKVSALGVEEQRVLVIVDILAQASQWQALGDGYRVEASFILWHGDDVLQVPEGALFRHGEGWATFVYAAGRAELRPVEVGRRAALRAQIVEGLRSGERVILHPADAVEDGGRVVERD